MATAARSLDEDDRKRSMTIHGHIRIRHGDNGDCSVRARMMAVFAFV